MRFEEAEQYIWNRPKFSRKLGLHRVEYILNHFSNPHLKLQIIHVAGTNGKGSVSTYIAGVLMEMGYNVGVYTSPHLLKLNERILLNSIPIDDNQVCRYVEKLIPGEKEMMDHCGECLSEFEVLTIIALLHYSFENPDFVILEVGLGGRLDATNICHPILSVITSISLDHQQFLGDTLEKITAEKSGIIKENVPLVVGKQKDDIVIKTILKKALEFDVKVYFVEEASIVGIGLHGMCVDVKTPFCTKYYHLESSMIGLYQSENIAISVSVIELLYREGYISNPKNRISSGIKKSFIPGRMQVIDENPIVIVDGAHNEMGLFQLKETVKLFLKKKIISGVIFVTGMMKDKVVKKQIKELSDLSENTIFVSLDMQRAMTQKELKEFYFDQNKNSYFEESLEQGVDIARKIALDKNMAVVVAGSLYLVAEVIALYMKDSHEK